MTHSKHHVLILAALGAGLVLAGSLGAQDAPIDRVARLLEADAADEATERTSESTSSPTALPHASVKAAEHVRGTPPTSAAESGTAETLDVTVRERLVTAYEAARRASRGHDAEAAREALEAWLDETERLLDEHFGSLSVEEGGAMRSTGESSGASSGSSADDERESEGEQPAPFRDPDTTDGPDRAPPVLAAAMLARLEALTERVSATGATADSNARSRGPEADGTERDSTNEADGSERAGSTSTPESTIASESLDDGLAAPTRLEKLEARYLLLHVACHGLGAALGWLEDELDGAREDILALRREYVTR